MEDTAKFRRESQLVTIDGFQLDVDGFVWVFGCLVGCGEGD